MYMPFLLFAALCNVRYYQQLNRCHVDADCIRQCPGSTGVCSPATRNIPRPHCHCQTPFSMRCYDLLHHPRVTQCHADADCIRHCPGSTGVCSPATRKIPQPHCHCQSNVRYHQRLYRCHADADCIRHCPGSTGVCSPATRKIRQPHCHCHDYGRFHCTTDQDCKYQCWPSLGCCHSSDHCHCGKSCSHYYH